VVARLSGSDLALLEASVYLYNKLLVQGSQGKVVDILVQGMYCTSNP
jgi:hypothetical protein